MWQIEIKKSAEKSLSKIPNKYHKKVKNRIDNLVHNPYPKECKKLKKIGNEPQYTVRIGQYRVVYEIHDDEVLILVMKIAHRKDIYE